MAFQGSLKELPLPDIIQLVSVSGKTGKFTLANDGENGYIYLKNGQMIHAEVGDVAGEEAIYALAIWNQGEFQFSPGEEPERQTITKSNTNLLMEAARRSDEWRVLSRKIPSVDAVPELHVRENRHEQITVNPQEWVLITRIDGRRSIAEIAHELSISSFDVAKILYGMLTSELVVLKKKQHEHEGGYEAVADRVRAIAEQHLGAAGQKSLEKFHHVAIEGIRRGGGERALRQFIEETVKTSALLHGLAASQRLHDDLTVVTGAPVVHG
jgi:hypothetical protein